MRRLYLQSDKNHSNKSLLISAGKSQKLFTSLSEIGWRESSCNHRQEDPISCE